MNERRGGTLSESRTGRRLVQRRPKRAAYLDVLDYSARFDHILLPSLSARRDRRPEAAYEVVVPKARSGKRGWPNVVPHRATTVVASALPVDDYGAGDGFMANLRRVIVEKFDTISVPEGEDLLLQAEEARRVLDAISITADDTLLSVAPHVKADPQLESRWFKALHADFKDDGPSLSTFRVVSRLLALAESLGVGITPEIQCSGMSLHIAWTRGAASLDWTIQATSAPWPLLRAFVTDEIEETTTTYYTADRVLNTLRNFRAT